jgi:hypothetical protein
MTVAIRSACPSSRWEAAFSATDLRSSGRHPIRSATASRCVRTGCAHAEPSSPTPVCTPRLRRPVPTGSFEWAIGGMAHCDQLGVVADAPISPRDPFRRRCRAGSFDLDIRPHRVQRTANTGRWRRCSIKRIWGSRYQSDVAFLADGLPNRDRRGRSSCRIRALTIPALLRANRISS